MTEELKPWQRSLRSCLAVGGIGFLLLIAMCVGDGWYRTRGFDGPRMLTEGPLRLAAGEVKRIVPDPRLGGPGPIHELCAIVAKPGTAAHITTPTGSEYVIVSAQQDTARLTGEVVGANGRKHQLTPTGVQSGTHLCFRLDSVPSPIVGVELTADHAVDLANIQWFSGNLVKFVI